LQCLQDTLLRQHFFKLRTSAEEWEEHTLSIFPNPAAEHITITSAELIQVDNNELTIKLAGWEPGIYLMHIKTGERMVVRKLMLQR
jgi:hypothetical protein